MRMSRRGSATGRACASIGSRAARYPHGSGHPVQGRRAARRAALRPLTRPSDRSSRPAGCTAWPAPQGSRWPGTRRSEPDATARATARDERDTRSTACGCPRQVPGLRRPPPRHRRSGTAAVLSERFMGSDARAPAGGLQWTLLEVSPAHQGLPEARHRCANERSGPRICCRSFVRV